MTYHRYSIPFYSFPSKCSQVVFETDGSIEEIEFPRDLPERQTENTETAAVVEQKVEHVIQQKISEVVGTETQDSNHETGDDDDGSSHIRIAVIGVGGAG